jgi:hypothetical protein
MKTIMSELSKIPNVILVWNNIESKQDKKIITYVKKLLVFHDSNHTDVINQIKSLCPLLADDAKKL